MSREDEDRLIEEVAAAWRPRDRDGRVREHPGWHDLAPADREAAARLAELQRALETLLDGDGHSTTVKAVLHRIRRARDPGAQ